MFDKNEVKFSVIMPMYNSERNIKKSIESIINQTYKNWELIIVDDGSTDNSLNICQEYTKKDKRIKVFHQDNYGPGSARNFGIKNSNGIYISFIDSDDYYEYDYFETIDNFIKIQEYDLIYFDRLMENKMGKVKNINKMKKFSSYTKSDLIKLQMMGIIPWGPCLKVAKREIVEECMFSNLKVGEEAIFSFNVLRKSKKIGFIDKVLYHYVYNETGQHTKGGYDPWRAVVNNMKDYLEVNKMYEKYSKSINGLALRALLIALYRYSNSDFSFLHKCRKIKEKVKEYKQTYNINNIDYQLLDKTSKIILKLINLKLYFVIIIASKIKAKNNK